jgi:hypothetical protein
MIEGYLCLRYGLGWQLPPSHPYYTPAPTRTPGSGGGRGQAASPCATPTPSRRFTLAATKSQVRCQQPGQ